MTVLKFEIISSDKETTYEVFGRIDSDGDSVWQCDCIGFAYRRNCRHINLAKKSVVEGLRKLEVIHE